VYHRGVGAVVGEMALEDAAGRMSSGHG